MKISGLIAVCIGLMFCVPCGVALCHLDQQAEAIAVPVPPGPLVNVEVDVLQTKTLWPTPGHVLTDTPQLVWPEDRFVIGWSPWIGFNKGMVMEGHCILVVNGAGTFLRGPHKEGADKMYDLTASEFFPAGYGRLVRAGQPVAIQFLAADTGSGPGSNAATANARIFSVRAN